MIRANFSRAFVIAGLLVVLWGCFPAAYTYWKPTGEWGKVVNPSEVNIVSADTLEVRVNAVRVRFSGNGTSVFMTVRIPEANSAMFVSNEIVLKDGNSTRIVKFESIQRGNEKNLLLPQDVMVGRKLYGRFVGDDEPLSYHVRIDVGPEEKRCYVIKPPAIRVADQVFEMPQIEFNKTTGVGMVSVNG